MAEFTPTQGRYLAFIQAYTERHGYPPAESEIAAAMCVSAPSVNQMVKTLEKKGLISRQPGIPRTIQVLLPLDEIPPWNQRQRKSGRHVADAGKRPRNPTVPRESALANLYVLRVFLVGGPVARPFAGKVCERVIEIRGDQTLDDLHNAIFQAYDRWEQHLYEFQLGKRPFDPKGPNYGIAEPSGEHAGGDARTTRLDDLKLKPERVFGYWFDFGDDWFHEIHVERIEQAIPTVRYPRVTRRVGKSPPQYSDQS